MQQAAEVDRASNNQTAENPSLIRIADRSLSNPSPLTGRQKPLSSLYQQTSDTDTRHRHTHTPHFKNRSAQKPQKK